MTDFVADTHLLTFQIGDQVFPCVIGRSGACAAGDKREGDGKTPLGTWPIRGVLLRPDRRWIPPTNLPWRWLREQDGWSDAPLDPEYNRPVRHPHGLAERLWRADRLYDVIVCLGHNDSPPIPGAGSAIFLHLREGEHTEGCVAIDRDAMNVVLRRAATGDRIDIR